MKYNPAEEGIEGAKEDMKKRTALIKSINYFRDFCLDSLSEGMAEGMDGETFLKACLETYVEIVVKLEE